MTDRRASVVHPPPDGIRTMPPAGGHGTTRLVLVRHGEAVCNVTGVCGGVKGCSGLTPLGVRQVTALRDRLAATAELAGATALYASVLPRAVQTAGILATALPGGAPAGGAPVGARVPAGSGPAMLQPVQDCGLCELHPGEADGLTWGEFAERYEGPDWDEDPGRPIAPGGESWTGFVLRASSALKAIAYRHRGEVVLVACHAGVVEASLLALLPVAAGDRGARLQLRTSHASMTTWEVVEGRWRLLRYNDDHHLAAMAADQLTTVSRGQPATASRGG